MHPRIGRSVGLLAVAALLVGLGASAHLHSVNSEVGTPRSRDADVRLGHLGPVADEDIVVAQAPATPQSTLPVLRLGETIFDEVLDPHDPPHGNRRRYQLDPALWSGLREVGGNNGGYEVRISYLGSPPASYRLTLLKVPKRPSFSSRNSVTDTTTLGRRLPSQRVLADTERLIFSLSDVNALPLSLERNVLSNLNDEGEQESTVVVEVVALPHARRRDGRAVVEAGEYLVRYNIKLDLILLGVPATMLPVLMTGVTLVLISLFCLTPLMIRVIQVPPMVPREEAKSK